MTIIGTLPATLTNGQTNDATQVMAELNYIVTQVNANAALAGLSGQYTPTTAIVSNVSSLGAVGVFNYCQIAPALVLVTGNFIATPSLSSNSVVSISLPPGLSSNFTLVGDSSGTMVGSGGKGNHGGIFANASSSLVWVLWLASVASSDNLFVNFTYRIK
jgi:hypothetical protein